jgi:hypothetical protein
VSPRQACKQLVHKERLLASMAARAKLCENNFSNI